MVQFSGGAALAWQDLSRRFKNGDPVAVVGLVAGTFSLIGTVVGPLGLLALSSIHPEEINPFSQSLPPTFVSFFALGVDLRPTVAIQVGCGASLLVGSIFMLADRPRSRSTLELIAWLSMLCIISYHVWFVRQSLDPSILALKHNVPDSLRPVLDESIAGFRRVIILTIFGVSACYLVLIYNLRRRRFLQHWHARQKHAPPE